MMKGSNNKAGEVRQDHARERLQNFSRLPLDKIADEAAANIGTRVTQIAELEIRLRVAKAQIEAANAQKTAAWAQTITAWATVILILATVGVAFATFFTIKNA